MKIELVDGKTADEITKVHFLIAKFCPSINEDLSFRFGMSTLLKRMGLPL
jgi:hypothetical protein